jgi:hypothetical protein
MKNSSRKHTQETDADPGQDVQFCLNCNDMDDLAVSDEARNVEQLRRRFNNCKETGRFDGDICARLYVAEDGIDDPGLFADADQV